MSSVLNSLEVQPSPDTLVCDRQTWNVEWKSEFNISAPCDLFWFPTVGSIFPTSSWILLEQDGTSCYHRLLAGSNYQGRFLGISAQSCRCPYNVANYGLLDGSPLPSHCKWYLLVYDYHSLELCGSTAKEDVDKGIMYAPVACVLKHRSVDIFVTSCDVGDTL